MNSDCAKPMCVTDLKKILQIEGKGDFDFDEQIKTNFAFVYYMKNGEVILIPASRSDQTMGLMFKAKKCFFDCLEKDSYPIQNDYMRLEEPYQEEIISINDNIEKIVVHLLTCLQLDLPITEIDVNSLSFLLYKLRENKELLGEKESFYTSLILGEYLRLEKKGKWITLKRYGQFNPYYIPAILYPNGKIVLQDFFIDFLESSYTLKNFCGFIFIDKPTLQLQGEPFNQMFHSYEILD